MNRQATPTPGRGKPLLERLAVYLSTAWLVVAVLYLVDVVVLPHPLWAGSIGTLVAIGTWLAVELSVEPMDVPPSQGSQGSSDDVAIERTRPLVNSEPDRAIDRQPPEHRRPEGRSGLATKTRPESASTRERIDDALNLRRTRCKQEQQCSRCGSFATPGSGKSTATRALTCNTCRSTISTASGRSGPDLDDLVVVRGWLHREKGT